MREYKLEIISLENYQYLKKILEDFPEKDIHYSPDYLKLFEDYLGEKGIYFLYGNNNGYILSPYFKRNISEKYFDLFSPWYYGGPIHNVHDKKELSRVFQKFRKDFNEYCQENNVVSEFQRLNPILGNYGLFENDSGLFYDREVVYVDLKKDLETIYHQYSRHTRKNLNRAREKGLKFSPVKNKESILKFIDIYSQAMTRKKAGNFYYFNDKFFHNLFEIFTKGAQLFQVGYKDKVIVSSLVLGKYGILYDYLRGAEPEYFPLRPNDILIDGIIKWAKYQGYQYFVLGGGRSSSSEDSLFKFKKSFSTTTAPFYTYRKIHNLKKYQDLIGQEEKNLKYEKAQFFPEYYEKLG